MFILRIVHSGVGPNDVAILKLASSLTLNSQITPIKLPAAGDNPQGTATLSGWGVINNNPIAQPPDNLYKVTTTTIPTLEFTHQISSSNCFI